MVYLAYEGDGEEGTTPWNSAENSLKNSQKYFWKIFRLTL
jgi:hypothetical protein